MHSHEGGRYAVAAGQLQQIGLVVRLLGTFESVGYSRCAVCTKPALALYGRMQLAAIAHPKKSIPLQQSVTNML